MVTVEMCLVNLCQGNEHKQRESYFAEESVRRDCDPFV